MASADPVPEGFARLAVGDGGWALVPSAFGPAGFLVAFTERTGGASDGAFSSLNLSFAVGDDPGAVRANRRSLAGALGVDRFASGEQVHGSTVAAIGPATAGAGFWDAASRIAGTDGLVTTDPGVAIAVLSADCLPIVLASPREGKVAVVHAGWRGLAGGIVDRALDGFERPGEVLAAIGPAIGPDHYEVGDDVAARVAAGAGGGALAERRGGGTFLDLEGTAARTLRARGVGIVLGSGLCTACHPDRFFSHRGEGGRTGRQAVVALRQV